MRVVTTVSEMELTFCKPQAWCPQPNGVPHVASVQIIEHLSNSNSSGQVSGQRSSHQRPSVGPKAADAAKCAYLSPPLPA